MVGATLIYAMRTLDESPRFYYNVKRYEDARIVLNNIA